MPNKRRKNKNQTKTNTYPLLCATVMVKNEAERITRTLSTVIDYADHIVILDTGSTDDTVNIVKKYCKEKNKPLKLKEEPFVDFAHSRNVMLKMCYGLSEFVLLLDANDEVKNPQVMIDYLKKIRNDKNDCALGCKFVWENDQVRDNNRTYYKIGIIRNNKEDIYYEFPIHEYITSSNPGKYYSNNNLQLSDFYIYQDREKDKDSTPRIKNDIKVLLNYIEENGKNERAYRFLCQSYCVLGDMENLHKYSDILVKYVTELYKKTKDKKITLDTKFSDNYYYGLMNRALSTSRLDYPDFQKDYLAAHKHCKIVFESADPFFELANEYLTKGNLELAYLYIKKACQIPEPSHHIQETQINYAIYRKHRWSSLYTIALKMDNHVDFDLACMKLHGKTGLRPIVLKGSPEAKNVNIQVVVKDEQKEAKNIQSTIKINAKTQEQLLEQNKDSVMYFIIPFRDNDKGERASQLQQIVPYMYKYLNFHKIIFKTIVVEQEDNSLFNKGLLYNIAASYINDYETEYINDNGFKNVYMCLHDVDILPIKGTNYYRPVEGIITHLYGYNFSLGGIIIINLNDYKKLNGFSNLYEGWGFEDNDFKRRVELNGLAIDRSYFYPRGSKECFQEMDPDPINESAKKMNLPQTKINQQIFLQNMDCHLDGLEQLGNYLDFIGMSNTNMFIKLNCNVEKIMQANNLRNLIPENILTFSSKPEIYIYDNNFYPDLGASRGHCPKHFNWKNLTSSPNVQINDSDLIVYSDNYLQYSLNNSLNCKKIAWLLEPPAINPQIYEFIKENYDKFDYVLTHNKELISLDDRILYYANGMCWIKEEDFNIYSKTKLVSIIASGKDFTVGHKMRNKFIKYCNENKDSLSYEVDVYGWRYKPLQYKLDGLKDYHFSIAIENTQMDNYFTEKIIDCFMTGTVPIYWGSPKLNEFFDPNGIITFNTLEELDDILNNLTSEDYNNRLESIKYNYEKAKEFTCAEDWICNNLDIFKQNGNILKVTHNAGFFSCCTVKLEKILEYFNQHKRLPDKVDSSQQFKSYKSKENYNVDITNRYFKENSPSQTPYSKEILVTSTQDEQQFSCYNKLNFDDIIPFIEKYFTPNNEINDIIVNMEKKYNLNYDNLATIYYRGTDKHLETNIASYDEFIKKATEIKSHNPNIQFLIQSDEAKFLETMKKYFPNSITIDEVNNDNMFIHSLYILALIIMISKTKIIICSSGNVSLWVMFYRHNADGVHQYLSPKEYIYGKKNESFDKNQTNFWIETI